MICSVLGSRASIGGVLGSGRGGAGDGLLTGLVAYWALDEASGNALDKHSGGLTLTQANSPGADTGKVYATARTFNGSSQYFYRASETAIQTGDVDFVLAVWVYLNTTPINALRIISKRSASTANDFDLYINANQSVEFTIGSATGSALVSTPANAITQSQWHLVMAWHDAASDLIWINADANTPASQATGGATPSASTAQLEIGRLNQLAARWWSGRLGPVAFWKNRTLSADDRAALWNGGNGLAYSAFTA